MAADLRFRPKDVSAAIGAGCAAVRVGPGTTKQFDDEVKWTARAAGYHGTPIRIGVGPAVGQERRLRTGPSGKQREPWGRREPRERREEQP
ncbi:4-hydroxy-3-methylbut-2-en-1-yl diphosphate synthase [Streptomyces sp. AVP053U2]|nr:4-hydroxy-3-methylbut-2-en-1-yl diphosphate synthase [Streptomyces sp. AVP053U2]